jgi:hypothetical protein
LEFETTSVVYPDPHGSEFILFGWIRIDVGKKDPEKKVKRCWMFSFEVWRLNAVKFYNFWSSNLKCRFGYELT